MAAPMPGSSVRAAANTLANEGMTQMLTTITAIRQVRITKAGWSDQAIWVTRVRPSSIGVRQVSDSTWRLPTVTCSQRSPGSRKLISVSGWPPRTA